MDRNRCRPTNHLAAGDAFNRLAVVGRQRGNNVSTPEHMDWKGSRIKAVRSHTRGEIIGTHEALWLSFCYRFFLKIAVSSNKPEQKLDLPFNQIDFQTPQGWWRGWACQELHDPKRHHSHRIVVPLYGVAMYI